MSDTFSYRPIDGAPIYQLIGSGQLEVFENFARQIQSQDGTPAFSEQTLVEVRKAAQQRDSSQWPPEPGIPGSYWIYQDGQAAGIVVVLNPADTSACTIEGAVLPTFRGQGLGSRLAQEVKKYLAQRPASYQLWAHQVLGEQGQELSQRAAHLAQELGLSPVRELRKLRLPLSEASRQGLLEAASAAPLPQDLQLRTFCPGQDDAAWLDLNAAAFASHPEQGSLTQADLQERLDSDWFRAEGFFLAESAGQLAGYHWTKIPAGQQFEGEVYAVGIAPDWQGKGLGRALTLAGMSYLAQAKIDSKQLEKITLYVDAENTAAVNLYQSLGFEAESIDIMYASVTTA